jgi:hypothetical protein
MKYKKGDVFRHKKLGFLVKIIAVSNDFKYPYEVVDFKEYIDWLSNNEELDEYYTHIKAYGTPLWKVMNGD